MYLHFWFFIYYWIPSVCYRYGTLFQAYYCKITSFQLLLLQLVSIQESSCYLLGEKTGRYTSMCLILASKITKSRYQKMNPESYMDTSMISSFSVYIETKHNIESSRNHHKFVSVFFSIFLLWLIFLISLGHLLYLTSYVNILKWGFRFWGPILSLKKKTKIYFHIKQYSIKYLHIDICT